jgi:MSHA biogenesis protein MshJ
MDNQIQAMKAWLKARDARERIWVMLLVMAITNFFWTFFIDRPITYSQKQLASQITAVGTSIEQVHQQVSSIESIVSKSAYLNKMDEKNRLTNQSQNFKQRILSLLPTIVSAEKLPFLLTDVVSQKRSVDFVSLKNLPVEPWIPDSLGDTQLPLNVKSIYKYSWTLEFHSSYFAAIDYLTRLEKLPWHIYWDNLSYTVTTYPDADVVATFHVISNRAG